MLTKHIEFMILFLKELDNLKRKYEKLILRNKDNNKSVQLAGFLEKYRAEQQRLIELKTREKLKSDQKLREKLAQRLRNKKVKFAQAHTQ